jgi:hypothetical protein
MDQEQDAGQVSATDLKDLDFSAEEPEAVSVVEISEEAQAALVSAEWAAWVG